MQIRAFKQLLERLSKLTRRQRCSLLETLCPMVRGEQVAEVIEQAAAARLAFPDCQAKQLHRHGRANGLQRYRCRACGRTFNSLTGTPLARLRKKSLWLDYCTSLLDPAATVRRSARTVGVHRNTSFRWRHRMLDWVKRDRPAPLAGIAEADEMYILESQKGSRALDRPARKRGGKARRRGMSREQVCVLVARDRSGRTHDFVTGRGPVTAPQLRRDLAPVLDQDVLLVTDSHPAYRAFARASGVQHATVNLSAGIRVDGALHVQNVNACNSRPRGWLAHFRGVATRHLPH
jgi:transposase-like protein